MLTPVIMQPVPEINERKWTIQENCPFYSILKIQSNKKDYWFCLESPLKYI